MPVNIQKVRNKISLYSNQLELGLSISDNTNSYIMIKCELKIKDTVYDRIYDATLHIWDQVMDDIL